uniref:hypothetical protein n=1 Tax=Actinotalea sp. TaxID=1872145 RepID=UPI00356AEA1D
MAPRIARPYWFRATGAAIPWRAVLEDQAARGAGFPAWNKVAGDLPQLDDRRETDLALRWQCRPSLGVPFGPFTVWRRPAKGRPQEIRVTPEQRSEGLLLRLPELSSAVTVTCEAVDPAAPVALLVGYGSIGLAEALAAHAVPAPGPGPVGLGVRCSGAWWALLVNGRSPQVRIEILADTLADPAWEPVEIVGLP